MKGLAPSSCEQRYKRLLPSYVSELHPERSAGYSMRRGAVDASVDSMTVFD